MRTRPAPIVAAVLVAILAASCQTVTSSPTSPPTGTSNPGPGGSPAVTPTGALSEDLIAAALAAGSIDYEQSLLYRAYALFDSPGLPDEYRSAVTDMGAGTELAAEIDEHEAELSADVLGKLAPYRVRPSDPTSIFSTGLTRPTAGALFAGGTATWESVVAVPGEARVWVRSEANGDLARHVADVAKVWAAYEDVFTKPDPDQAELPTKEVNPDALVDFYFVAVSDLDPRVPTCLDPATEGCSLSGTSAAGMARPAPPIRANASSAYFVLDGGRSGDDALFQLAHEIAHGGEFHYDKNEASWFFEATANWVAYRVFQKLGKVPHPAYGWLSGTSGATGFFDRLDRPLDTDSGLDAYGAWLYFQFAAMQRGDAIVTDMWKKAGGIGAQGATAIDSVLPFEANFREFALRNWNKEPVPNRYRSAPDPTFPNLQPKKTADETVLPAETYAVVVQLPRLSATYHSYVIDPKARKIEFENPLVGRPGFHLWAIKNINETWQEPEDWTNEASKKFCRDVAAEDVGQIILIASNSSLAQTFDPGESPTITGKASGCGDWRGTMTGTHTWSTLRGSGQASSTFEGIWTESENKLLQPCQAESLGAESCVVYLPEGTIKWTWHATQNELGMNCEQTTGGSVAAGGGLHLDAQMLVLEPVQPDGFKYWGNGQVIATPATCWAAVESNSQQPPQFFYVDQFSSSANPPSVGNTCYSLNWEIDPAGDSITGACVEYDYGYNTMSYEWNLTRIGPPPGGG